MGFSIGTVGRARRESSALPPTGQGCASEAERLSLGRGSGHRSVRRGTVLRRARATRRILPRAGIGSANHRLGVRPVVRPADSRARRPSRRGASRRCRFGTSRARRPGRGVAVRPSEGRGTGVLVILGVELPVILVELFPAADVVRDVGDEDGDEHEEGDQRHGVTVLLTRLRALSRLTEPISRGRRCWRERRVRRCAVPRP